MEVIEHLEKPETAIGGKFRIGKPGGKVMVVFPNDAFFKVARLVSLKFKGAYDPGHVHHGALCEMKQLLCKHGFTVHKMKAIPFCFWNLFLHGVV